MVDIKINLDESPAPKNPVTPKLFDGDYKINFHCHPKIACFNACCGNIDIALTPHDIVRLKQHLGLSSGEFLRNYTYRYEMEQGGISGVKFKPVDDGTACRFMTDAGCRIYAHRPTACRYYPVGLVSLRKQDEYTDQQSYALVEEPHCLGHQQARTMTIDQYRQEQGVIESDPLDRGWRQLVLQKKSSGPAFGKPSARSLRLFFMTCYDIDSFRAFVSSEGFQNGFDLTPEQWQAVLASDSNLLQFGFKLLKQVLFGEQTIPIKQTSAQARQHEKGQKAAQLAAKRAQYDVAYEPVELD